MTNIEIISKKISEFKEIVVNAENNRFIDAVSFNKKYYEIVGKIDAVMPSLEGDDNSVEDVTEQYNTLEYMYERGMAIVNEQIMQVVNETAEVRKELAVLREKTEMAQPIQLAIFSVVLTVLSFILANAVRAPVSSFKIIVLNNLSYLFMSVVLFSFVYLFLSLPRKEKKAKVNAIVTMIILAVVVMIAICVIASIETV
jgi:heme/copper-type cytochrome/quinol oxidase subunit 4